MKKECYMCGKKRERGDLKEITCVDGNKYGVCKEHKTEPNYPEFPKIPKVSYLKEHWITKFLDKFDKPFWYYPILVNEDKIGASLILNCYVPHKIYWMNSLIDGSYQYIEEELQLSFKAVSIPFSDEYYYKNEYYERSSMGRDKYEECMYLTDYKTYYKLFHRQEYYKKYYDKMFEWKSKCPESYQVIHRRYIFHVKDDIDWDKEIKKLSEPLWIPSKEVEDFIKHTNNDITNEELKLIDIYYINTPHLFIKLDGKIRCTKNRNNIEKIKREFRREQYENKPIDINEWKTFCKEMKL